MKSTLGKLRKAAALAAMSALALATVPKDVSRAEGGNETTTPIEHLVVIFQENITFDHYFATYPRAENPPGEPIFHARSGTPSVNGLSGALLTNNPNSAQPFRLDRSQQLTCSQNGLYTPYQQAYHAGLLDKFVEFTGSTADTIPPCEFGRGRNVVMGYYDGNTVTALWNYAQHFAMSDNSYETVFGPSTPGHINLISGQTHGVDVGDIPNVVVEGTVIANGRPRGDPCGTAPVFFMMTGRNVGDLLNDKGITWGWFSGGFAARNPDGTVNCDARHMTVTGFNPRDYNPVTEPFQFYESTRNPDHMPPSSVEMIGHTDLANHQYDLSDFWRAADSGNLPAVSFLKAAGYQQGHPQISDPQDEQIFLVNTINRLQHLPEWRSMAVIIAYDDPTAGMTT